MSSATKKLAALTFTDSFVRSLPADPSRDNRSRQVPGACFSFVDPTPVARPKLLGWSDDLGITLGISRPAPDDKTAAAVLAGNQLLPGMRPYAARYGGHQFGHWAGQLGDGRAITLGELIAPDQRSWELQLKGAGPTPYSRRADGRAVLRSSLREFLCSEAMSYLGIPTTRALSLVVTGDTVVRDMFYDGNPEQEPGAIVCRVAPSFLRFGNFEILAANGEIENLQQLADYAIRKHFPEFTPLKPESYGQWFAEICRRTANLVVDWQRVGFVHGVMNTDNMSLLGLTIDYGPYGWLEDFDQMWTPNTTDAEGRRYCYGRQPQIAYWNVERFALALQPLFAKVGTAAAGEQGLAVFRDTFNANYRRMFAHKIGLTDINQEGDAELVTDWLQLLSAVETDMTLAFRALADIDITGALGEHSLAPLEKAMYQPAQFDAIHRNNLLAWLERYSVRVQHDEAPVAERKARMNRINPKYVLRNYMAQEAIEEATQGNTARLERLLQVLKYPYDEQPEQQDLAAKRPEWARHRPGCSALSCSS